jgi:hypothetical protein
MTTADRIIFVYGVFVTLLLIAGLIFTIKEMHKMGANPEKYRPEPWFTKPKARPMDD